MANFSLFFQKSATETNICAYNWHNEGFGSPYAHCINWLRLWCLFDVVVRTNAQGVWRSVGGPDQCRHHATCDRVTMRNLENRCTIALAWVEWTERRDCEKQQQNQRLNLQYNFCMMSWNLSTLFVCWWTDSVLLCADLYVFSSSPVFRARRRLFFFLLCFSVDQVIISAIFGTVSNDI